MTTGWEELRPKFRRAILRDRGRGRTMQAVADDLHVGRRTIYRLISDEAEPRRAVRYLVETYMERVEREDPGE